MSRATSCVLLKLIISLGSTSAVAEWTGISVDIGETTTDLQFETAQRTMRSDSLSLRIEEKTATNLRVGFNLGISNIRTANILPPDNAQKFDGGHLGFYLRYPLQLGRHMLLEGLFSYRYNSASDSNNSLQSEIEWREARVQLSLGVKFGVLHVTPFIVYRDINGDISNDSGTEIFDSVDSKSRGISFDIFVEPTAYIRFQLSRGDEEGGYLTFARIY